VKNTYVEIMDTNVKIIILDQEFDIQRTKKIVSNNYEPQVVLEDKVCLKMYYSHQWRNVAMDEILAKIKAQGL
jgi:hypothetical protein